MFKFEKLDVWQKAIDFADLVYNSTRNFPSEERFGLTNQMRRAAVSISSNIAEGTSRMSQTDFKRFVEIATGSVFEVISQAFIGKRQGLLTPGCVFFFVFSSRRSRPDAQRTAQISIRQVTSVHLSTINYQP